MGDISAMIKVQCNCGAKINAKDTWAGKTGKCPKCGQPILIPAIAPAEVTPAAIVEPVVPLTPVLAPPKQTHFVFSKNGKQIVGKSPIILRNCVVCGSELAPAEIKTWTVTYAPAAALGGLLGGGILGAFVGKLGEKQCEISYGICTLCSQSIAIDRAKRIKKSLYLSLIAFFSFAYMVLVAWCIAGALLPPLLFPLERVVVRSKGLQALCGLCLPVFIGSLGYVSAQLLYLEKFKNRNSKMNVSKYDATSETFWIEGLLFEKKFLDSYKRQ